MFVRDYESPKTAEEGTICSQTSHVINNRMANAVLFGTRVSPGDPGNLLI